MKAFIKPIGALVGLILVVLYLSAFTVYEGQRAIVLKLGKIKKDGSGAALVYGPGLHFKTPFVTTANIFDVRLQSLDMSNLRILTAEQKYVVVSYYAKWRITNIPLYYKRTAGSELRAKRLLEQKINDTLRAAFGNRKIKDVISVERLNIMQLLRERANKAAENLGIVVQDVRIEGIDLPNAVRDSVYERMRTERKQVAAKHRAQGKAEGEAVRANADAQVTVIIATAQKQSQHTRAKGDESAANIYANAYQKDANFYDFYRSLDVYRHTLGKDTILVLHPDGHFFRVFEKGKP